MEEDLANLQKDMDENERIKARLQDELSNQKRMCVHACVYVFGLCACVCVVRVRVCVWSVCMCMCCVCVCVCVCVHACMCVCMHVVCIYILHAFALCLELGEAQDGVLHSHFITKC